ncbi:MAG: N-acetylgalactosamine-6-sulfatase [Limisphaerales bacterium]|nr:MAG: N-acetylgalactosamine-6-sulfatase [Limisphaerales bacterium]KAG0510217.1 MAG: N-acetylgalactosamine-6-sulfatase [Limisphaerales bacterium]TXT51900.1 MAG: N-acetylgalactosamine-6-sulfatase [Limisphaerales bacterium]
MKLAVGWFSFVLCLLPLASSSASAASRPPNIVLILADDLGYAELGCQGSKDIPTPHLDSLARNGVRCTAGYVTASFCTPSRAGLLTGRSQTRFGHELNVVGRQNLDPAIGLPLTEKTLADHLKARGYATGCIGKWHLGATEAFHPQRRGFDEFFGFLHEGHFYVPGPPWTGVTTWLRTNSLPPGSGPRLTQGDVIFSTHLKTSEPRYDDHNPLLRGTQPVTEREYLTDALARESVAFIGRHRAEPFFLYLAFNAPHSPVQAPPKCLHRFAHIPDIHRRLFAAMVSAMDDTVGAVLQKLREEKLEEQTLIVFLSDNGGPTAELTSSNAPFSGGKGSFLEGGLRVPFLVQWRGQLPAGKTFAQPVSSLDLAPTFLNATGSSRREEAPSNSKPPTPNPKQNQSLLTSAATARLEGLNLLPLLRSEAPPPARPLFWRMGRQAAMRDGDWKLLRTGDQPWQLFNLATDPAEQTNLAAAQPAVVEQLAAAWAKWNQQNIPPLWGLPPGVRK